VTWKRASTKRPPSVHTRQTGFLSVRSRIGRPSRATVLDFPAFLQLVCARTEFSLIAFSSTHSLREFRARECCVRCLVAAKRSVSCRISFFVYHVSCIKPLLYRSLWDFIFYINNFASVDIFLSHISSKVKSNESDRSRYRRDIRGLVALCLTPRLKVAPFLRLVSPNSCYSRYESK